MSGEEVKYTNFRTIQFTRDTTVDYKKGDPLINSIFKQWDEDSSGNFNDEEWMAYQDYLTKIENRQKKLAEFKANPELVAHYKEPLSELEGTAEELSKEMETLYKEKSFDKLLEFEANHPGVTREGCIDYENLPENAVKYDISPFEMGIYDEEKGCYTGEAYTNGYISGLETLSEEERNEYMTLLDKATETARKSREIEMRRAELDEKMEKLEGLLDMVNNGIITEIGTPEYENEMYSKYREIINSSNPFFDQIKATQAEYNRIVSNRNRTKEEDGQLKQLSIQLEQLQISASNWKLSDCMSDWGEFGNKNQCGENGEQAPKGFQITDLSETVTYKEGSALSNPQIIDRHSIGATYIFGKNFNLNGNFSKEERYNLNSSGESYENALDASLTSRYNVKDFSVMSMTNFSTESSYTNLTQYISAEYKQLGLNFSETLYTSREEIADESGNTSETSTTTETTNIGLTYKTGKFSNSASVSWAEDGTTYSLGSSAYFTLQKNKQNNPDTQKKQDSIKVTVAPSMSVDYNNKTNSITLNPQMRASMEYGWKDIKVKANISERFTNTTTPGAKPVQTNTLGLNASTDYKKKYYLGVSFNDSDYTSYHSNTYGVNAGYNSSKCGNFSLEYSNQKDKYKSNGSNKEANTLTFTYSAPLDTINSWFKKKKN